MYPYTSSLIRILFSWLGKKSGRVDYESSRVESEMSHIHFYMKATKRVRSPALFGRLRRYGDYGRSTSAGHLVVREGLDLNL